MAHYMDPTNSVCASSCGSNWKARNHFLKQRRFVIWLWKKCFADRDHFRFELLLGFVLFCWIGFVPFLLKMLMLLVAIERSLWKHVVSIETLALLRDMSVEEHMFMGSTSVTQLASKQIRAAWIKNNGARRIKEKEKGVLLWWKIILNRRIYLVDRSRILNMWIW